MIFVDHGYKTRLGTSFYDRRSELDALERLVSSYRTTIVYGPRNAGKSELVRYWARRKRGDRGIVTVEGDLVRSGRIVEAFDWYLPAAGEHVMGALARALEALPGKPGILDIYLAARKLYNIIRAKIGDVILFIDEFHLLPGYEEPPVPPPTKRP